MAISHRESAYCPTCGTHSTQIRGRERGTRHCMICGTVFTLAESRAAEAKDTSAGRGDNSDTLESSVPALPDS